MSIFAEFQLDTESLALHETLTAHPEAVIEVERVVASDKVLTPYFWVSSVDLDEFEATAANDPTIQNLRLVDEFDEVALYRADWIEDIMSITYSLLDIASVILGATGTHKRWEVQLRFDTQKELSEFREFCREHDIGLSVERLYHSTQPLTGSQYNLTAKQQEALKATWEAGYFESPRRATLSEIADDLGITQQSLSTRLRRAHQTLIANTITMQGQVTE